MYYALIKNEEVENVIVADEEFIQHLKTSEDTKDKWDDFVYVPDYAAQGIGPGVKYKSSEFIKPSENTPELSE